MSGDNFEIPRQVLIIRSDLKFGPGHVAEIATDSGLLSRCVYTDTVWLIIIASTNSPSVLVVRQPPSAGGSAKESWLPSAFRRVIVISMSLMCAR